MPMEEPSRSAELRAAVRSEPDVRRQNRLGTCRSRRADDVLSAVGASCFVALDFETADQGRDSACAIALVRVEGGSIVRREHHLIRPPRRTFLFTSIHGIDWPQVADAPGFGELWPQLAGCLEGARFIAAHNASFDAGVLRACCERAGLRPPAQPFLCTVQVARQTWNLRPTRLPDVCRHLGLPLRHHDALSDAEACAGIVLAAG